MTGICWEGEKLHKFSPWFERRNVVWNASLVKWTVALNHTGMPGMINRAHLWTYTVRQGNGWTAKPNSECEPAGVSLPTLFPSLSSLSYRHGNASLNRLPANWNTCRREDWIGERLRRRNFAISWLKCMDAPNLDSPRSGLKLFKHRHICIWAQCIHHQSSGNVF